MSEVQYLWGDQRMLLSPLNYESSLGNSGRALGTLPGSAPFFFTHRLVSLNPAQLP